MADKNLEQQVEEKLTLAYDSMMQYVHSVLDNTEKNIIPSLLDSIETAKLHAQSLKKLSEEEAEKLGNYLLRDLHDAAHHIEHSGEQLATWFRFDIALIEAQLLELFSRVADKSRLELNELTTQAILAQQYKTGEITSIGTLTCQSCKQTIHFTKTSRIPPCPKCSSTQFGR